MTNPNTTESSVEYRASSRRLKRGVRQNAALSTIIERVNFGENWKGTINENDVSSGGGMQIKVKS